MTEMVTSLSPGRNVYLDKYNEYLNLWSVQILEGGSTVVPPAAVSLWSFFALSSLEMERVAPLPSLPTWFPYYTILYFPVLANTVNIVDWLIDWYDCYVAFNSFWNEWEHRPKNHKCIYWSEDVLIYWNDLVIHWNEQNLELF